MRLVPRALAAACALALIPAAAAVGDTGNPNKLVDTYPAGELSRASSTCTSSSARSTSTRARTRSRYVPIKADGLPSVPGYVTSFKPNLTYLDGTVPGVDVVHLHHGVWLVDGAPEAAVGRGEDDRRPPAGLRRALRPGPAVGDGPHDPRPRADPDQRLHHVRPDVRARTAPPPRRTSSRCARSGSTSPASGRIRSSTRRTELRAQGALHVPGHGAHAARRAARSGRRTSTSCRTT